MNKTIEQTVAETILEQPFEVKVGEKSYQVASASTATLILVSEAISQLPHIALDTEMVVEETLSVAKDCRILGDIAAILILGAIVLVYGIPKDNTKQICDTYVTTIFTSWIQDAYTGY